MKIVWNSTNKGGFIGARYCKSWPHLKLLSMSQCCTLLTIVRFKINQLSTTKSNYLNLLCSQINFEKLLKLLDRSDRITILSAVNWRMMMKSVISQNPSTAWNHHPSSFFVYPSSFFIYPSFISQLLKLFSLFIYIYLVKDLTLIISFQFLQWYSNSH